MLKSIIMRLDDHLLLKTDNLKAVLISIPTIQFICTLTAYLKSDDVKISVSKRKFICHMTKLRRPANFFFSKECTK